MATLLSLLHSQLPRLRSLVLVFGNSCKGRYVRRSVWEQLGAATQLRRLQLWFGDQVSCEGCGVGVGWFGGVRACSSSGNEVVRG